MFQPRIILCLCILFFAQFSYSFAAGLVSTVSSPDVAKNVLNAGFRSGYDLGETDTESDNNFIMRQQFEYGFTNLYSARLQFIQNRPTGGQIRQNAVGFQNRIEFADEQKDGWGASVRASYQYRSGRKRHDTIRTSFLYLLPDIAGAEFRQNILLEYNVDRDMREGFELEFRSQITAPLFDKNKDIRIGIEMMNIFPSFTNHSLENEDTHQIGPIIKANLTDKLSLQTGYRFTTNGTTDVHGIMLYFGRKFNINY